MYFLETLCKDVANASNEERNQSHAKCPKKKKRRVKKYDELTCKEMMDGINCLHGLSKGKNSQKVIITDVKKYQQQKKPCIKKECSGRVVSYNPESIVAGIVDYTCETMNPEVSCRLIEFLVNECDMSKEEAEDFIYDSRLCGSDKLQDTTWSSKHQAKWVRGLSKALSTRTEQYFNTMLLSQRDPLVKEMTKEIMKQFTKLTGEEISFKHPKTKMQQLTILGATRLGMWIDELVKDLDKPVPVVQYEKEIEDEKMRETEKRKLWEEESKSIKKEDAEEEKQVVIENVEEDAKEKEEIKEDEKIVEEEKEEIEETKGELKEEEQEEVKIEESEEKEEGGIEEKLEEEGDVKIEETAEGGKEGEIEDKPEEAATVEIEEPTEGGKKGEIEDKPEESVTVEIQKSAEGGNEGEIEDKPEEAATVEVEEPAEGGKEVEIEDKPEEAVTVEIEEPAEGGNEGEIEDKPEEATTVEVEEPAEGGKEVEIEDKPEEAVTVEIEEPAEGGNEGKTEGIDEEGKEGEKEKTTEEEAMEDEKKEEIVGKEQDQEEKIDDVKEEEVIEKKNEDEAEKKDEAFVGEEEEGKKSEVEKEKTLDQVEDDKKVEIQESTLEDREAENSIVDTEEKLSEEVKAPDLVDTVDEQEEIVLSHEESEISEKVPEIKEEEKPVQEELVKSEASIKESTTDLFSDILSIIKEDIAVTQREKETDRQKLIKDAINKRLEMIIDRDKDKIKPENIEDAASQVAYWIDKIMEPTETFKKGISHKEPGPAFAIKQITGSTLEIHKLGSNSVSETTAQVRGAAPPSKTMKTPTSESPLTLTSTQEWFDWVTNMSSASTKLGEWIDSTLTDAEKQIVDKSKGRLKEDRDWKQWQNQAQLEAHKLRVKTRKIKDEGQIWSKKLKKEEEKIK